jgi:hypothetical protein
MTIVTPSTPRMRRGESRAAITGRPVRHGAGASNRHHRPLTWELDDRPPARGQPISFPGAPSSPGPASNDGSWAMSTQCWLACAAGGAACAASRRKCVRSPVCGGGLAPLLCNSCVMGLASPRCRRPPSPLMRREADTMECEKGRVRRGQCEW